MHILLVPVVDMKAKRVSVILIKSLKIKSATKDFSISLYIFMFNS